MFQEEEEKKWNGSTEIRSTGWVGPAGLVCVDSFGFGFGFGSTMMNNE